MKRPVDTANTYRHPHAKPKLQPDVSPMLVNSAELDSPAASDELLQHETQKRGLAYKLSQLCQEYANEDSKRRKLEDDLARARTRLNSVLDTNPETEEFRLRIKNMQEKLESVQTRFSDNLDLLLDYRAQLDQISKPSSGPGIGTGRKPRQEFGHLSEIEKVELAHFDRDLDRLAKSGPNKRAPQLSIKPEPDRATQGLLRYREMFQLALEVLGLNSLPDLFTEVENLERENTELSESIADHERIKDSLVAEVAALENQYTDISSEPELLEEAQREVFENLALEVAELQRGLSQIQAQKVKDEREFSQIYGELEDIFRAMDCNWERVAGEGKTVTAENVTAVLEQLEETVRLLISEQKTEET
jgi:predicted RNase H-like nuclease (RuvC/YqgF family)